jgi:hypothetical protein
VFTIETEVQTCVFCPRRCLRAGFAARDSSKASSGLFEPTRLTAVRALTPKMAPASARERQPELLQPTGCPT